MLSLTTSAPISLCSEPSLWHLLFSFCGLTVGISHWTVDSHEFMGICIQCQTHKYHEQVLGTRQKANLRPRAGLRARLVARPQGRSQRMNDRPRESWVGSASWDPPLVGTCHLAQMTPPLKHTYCYCRGTVVALFVLWQISRGSEALK
jgi:hypothetical protein